MQRDRTPKLVKRISVWRILADLSNQNGESTWSNQHVLCVVSKSSNKWSWNHQKSGIWQQLNWLGVFRSQRVTVIRWAYHMGYGPIKLGNQLRDHWFRSPPLDIWWTTCHVFLFSTSSKFHESSWIIMNQAYVILCGGPRHLWVARS